jgi:nitrous oxidase accessory protein
MKRALVVIGMLALAIDAEARVWTVGPAGSDFPLIAPALAAAAPGDVIVVRAGVYREDLVLARQVTIVGEGLPVLFGTGAGTVITVAADGCEIRGMRIEGTGVGQTNQADAAILLRSSGNRVVGNRMTRVFYGVVIAEGSRNEVVDNTIEGLMDRPFGERGDGVYVYRASGNFVRGNRIRGQRDGIYFQYAPDGVVVGNIVTDSRYGLHVMFASGISVRDNVFSENSIGANIMNSRRVDLTANTLERNRGVTAVALSFKDCDASTVRENRFVGNLRALQLDGSSGNRISANTFSRNDTAVILFSTAEKNVFTGNHFDDNWSDVVLRGRGSSTAWSEGGVGNQWSRYEGFDFTGDGIGETPHQLLGAFEQLEGRNPAVRLFLQSPAAAALALGARLIPSADEDLDRYPVTGSHAARAPEIGPRARPMLFSLGMGLLGLGGVYSGRRRPCSKS